MLGDACLEKNCINFRIKIDHTEKYKDYIFWLNREMKPFSLKPRLITETDKRKKRFIKDGILQQKVFLPLIDIMNYFILVG